ncbi:MAG: rhomboid family intramembrane serine protease, partial [Candidatus Binatus sp.]
MIPLRDNAAPRRLTPINSALLAANVAVFVYEVALGARVAAFVERFAMVPAAVTRALSTDALAWHGHGAHRSLGTLAPLMTTVTSMFIHGGFWHVAGNMLYLFIFGAAVEYRMGAARYLIFYFAAGIAAALATVW